MENIHVDFVIDFRAHRIKKQARRNLVIIALSRNEGSSEPAQLRILAIAFAARIHRPNSDQQNSEWSLKSSLLRICEKYPNYNHFGVSNAVFN